MALDLSQTATDLIRSLAAKAEDEVFYVCYETGGITNPDTGQVSPGVVTKTPIDAARVSYRQSLIDGVNIKTGDFQLLVPPNVILPNTQFYFENKQGERYSSVSVDEVNHAGAPQMYKFQLRRS